MFDGNVSCIMHHRPMYSIDFYLDTKFMSVTEIKWANHTRPFDSISCTCFFPIDRTHEERGVT